MQVGNKIPERYNKDEINCKQRAKRTHEVRESKNGAGTVEYSYTKQKQK